jgi:hypothetical protein
VSARAHGAVERSESDARPGAQRVEDGFEQDAGMRLRDAGVWMD